ncbi:DUF732 domain-containing protein [Candidatus Mycobacterium methanotrophicum]|uniref:DUF732 domain-containing protein n=1 Tax=Candidatus Mycobacterium methanotrophicum TaxID=2943498 RepID=A0ABY4QPA8_9MYCO|nr:DUF732 domain-containing protein [Candidatus Mycobacterium methanotrophicum]UQX12454.1 DUF732 domain-containing protein [Candidatus Mycobacterium methanotrophicum]
MKHARWLFTVAGAVAAIGLGAPAHADNADTAFLDQLDQAGIEYANAQDTISMGKEVCARLAGGRSPTVIARSLKISNHHLSANNCAQFVAISAQVYCPAQLPAAGAGG